MKRLNEFRHNKTPPVHILDLILLHIAGETMDPVSFRFMHTKHHISKVSSNILVLVIVFFALSICV